MDVTRATAEPGNGCSDAIAACCWAAFSMAIVTKRSFKAPVLTPNELSDAAIPAVAEFAAVAKLNGSNVPRISPPGDVALWMFK